MRPADRSVPFSDELEVAKRLYRRGCHEAALALLKDLDLWGQVDDAVSVNETIEQRAYLAEVLLILGRRAEARDVFKLLLSAHPDARLSLLEHDPGAVTLFEAVRTETSSPPPPADLRARPVWTYLPYGVAHLHNGDRGRAVGYGLAQASLAGISAGTLVAYLLTPRDPIVPGSNRLGTRREDTLRRVTRLRVVNYTASAGFVIVYAISQADASARWKAKQRAKLTVTPFGVGMSGRF